MQEGNQAPGVIPRQGSRWWAHTLVILFIAVLIFPLPDLPDASPGNTPIGNMLDWVWQAYLHEQVGTGLVFGRDIIFTYGPASFLFIPIYHPNTLFICIAFWMLHALLISCGVWACLLQVGQTPLSRELWSRALWSRALYAVMTAAVLAGSSDAYMAAVPILLVALTINRPSHGRLIRTLAIILAAFCGIMVWGKISQWVILVAGMSAVTAVLLLHRRVPWELLAFSITAFLTWLIVGPPLNGLYAFVKGAAEIVSGYEAMALGLNVRKFVAIGFAAMAIPAVVIILVGLRKQGWFIAMIAASFAALGLFAAFKHATIRCDLIHILAGGAVMYLAVVFLLPNRGRLAWFRPTWTLAMSALLFVVPASQGLFFTAPNIWLHRFSTAQQLIETSGDYSSAWDRAMQAVRKKFPIDLPKNESVDIFSFNRAIATANGLTISSRPIFQSYSVYTPYLAKKNAEFFSGPRAPRYVVVSLDAIDERLPLMEDSLAWVEILRGYEKVNTTSWGAMIFEKRAAPLDVVESIERKLKPDAQGWIDLPHEPGLMIVKTKLIRSFWSGIATTLTYPTPWVMELRNQSGDIVVHPFYPPLSSSGFIASPYVPSTPAIDNLIAQFADPPEINLSKSDPAARPTSIRFKNAGQAESLEVSVHTVRLATGK